MYSNSMWELVDLSKVIKPIWCKWTYKAKINVDGKVETYKAKLVAKGIDYKDTFSPIAMLKSICILLSIRTTLNY
ncbi:Retrovirus-related Pol polyprotein from transposon TNT 1-94 [Gossypium australe]|uniref:Retrovirus-related Pol polyprotein from transposon TNT 1-94 n=1 Tax=Gossypium australe TaxID=47621 RepID=A0A5B6X3D1_9ROSI|nr:Retrovirus-related Pol polyprotein from transposon TNT 1-94 [Gossypium australe]